MFSLYDRYCMIEMDAGRTRRVRAADAELRHKLFPPNAWMKVLHFNVLTSCPKDELHRWCIGLSSYGEHIILAIMHWAAMFMRLAVKLWQAPASRGWPSGRQDQTDSQ